MPISLSPLLSRTDVEQSADQPPENVDTAGDGGGSWRRRAVLISAGVATLAIARRFRHRSRSPSDKTAATEKQDPSTAAADASDSTGGRSLMEKLGVGVTLVGTVLVVRRIRKWFRRREPGT